MAITFARTTLLGAGVDAPTTDVADPDERGSGASDIAIESRMGLSRFRTLELPDTFSVRTQNRPARAT